MKESLLLYKVRYSRSYAIVSISIPALTGQPPPNDELRDLLALPARLGGLALTNPMSLADLEYSASSKVSNALKNAILQQSFHYPGHVIHKQEEAKGEVRRLKRDSSTQTAASIWLTSLPIQEFRFALHKRAFQDAPALRYSWQPLRSPTTCDCGTKFSIEHALSCPKGGFPSVRHNEIRDLTANLLTEVCNDVYIEPDLQPIDGVVLPGSSSNTQDGARLDIAANGILGGRDTNAPSLMCGSSTLMPPPTDILTATKSMS